MKSVTVHPARLAVLILALMILTALATHHFSKPDQTLHECEDSKQKWIEAYNNCHIENAEICDWFDSYIYPLIDSLKTELKARGDNE